MATHSSFLNPTQASGTSTSPSTPWLENGDRLDRAEFERRYDAMPALKKAELIRGVVYMPSPVRLRSHGQPHADLIGWLSLYRARTPGTLLADNASIRLSDEDMPQPDALLMIEPERGGRSRLSQDDYVVGAPELVVEIASSSVSLDLHLKKSIYEQFQVQEYLVWRVLEGAIDWFALRDGRFVSLDTEADGVLRSRVFPGLWLNASALLRGDLPTVFDTLERGLAHPEHTAFRTTLQA